MGWHVNAPVYNDTDGRLEKIRVSTAEGSCKLQGLVAFMAASVRYIIVLLV